MIWVHSGGLMKVNRVLLGSVALAAILVAALLQAVGFERAITVARCAIWHARHGPEFEFGGASIGLPSNWCPTAEDVLVRTPDGRRDRIAIALLGATAKEMSSEEVPREVDMRGRAFRLESIATVVLGGHQIRRATYSATGKPELRSVLWIAADVDLTVFAHDVGDRELVEVEAMIAAAVGAAASSPLR